MDYNDAMEKLQAYKKIMWERMETEAEKGLTITYFELVKGSGVENFLSSVEVRDALSHILNEIGKEADEKGLPMLTAVAVLKESSQPGTGFYDLANELPKFRKNASKDEKIYFWSAELKKVFTHYQKESN